MSIVKLLENLRAHYVAEFFQVRRSEVRISSVAAMDVFIDAMNIQRQRVKKLRLQQHQCHYKCYEYSAPVSQKAPPTAAPVSLQMSWIFSNSVSKSSAYSNTSVTTNVMNIQRQCVKKLRLQQHQRHYKCHEYSAPACQKTAPTAAMSISEMNMQYQHNGKKPLQQHQCRYRRHEYSTPVCQEAPPTPAPVCTYHNTDIMCHINVILARNSLMPAVTITSHWLCQQCYLCQS